MAPKNFLNHVTIPSPCSADWNSMIGNDQVRFCGHCNLDVHNLSQMTRRQAERLVARSNGRLCVRYHQNAAGRPATLPTGRKLHHIGRRVSRLAAGAFTATLSVTSAVAQGSVSYREVPNPSVARQPNARWTSNSSIVGAVKDQNGALIPGATVFVSHDEFKVALYASAGADGQFKIDSLQPGVYQVRIEAPGFAADQSAGVYVPANGAARVDRTLQVIEIKEEVEVETSSFEVQQSFGGAVAYISAADPFVRAAQEDDLEALTALIAGQDVNLRDGQSGTTALEHAVKNANLEMVELLLSSGANVNAKNEDGATVLMMLDDDATSDLVWELINAGADVNLKDESGNTALMQTASENNSEALKALLDAGAEVNTRNEDGRTALMLAAADGMVNNVRALVLAGADINAVDEDDDNALSLAAANDHLPVVRFLRSKGAVQAAAKVEKEK